MRVYGYSAAFALVCALSACGSVPGSAPGSAPNSRPDTAPYWADPKFEAALFEAVQSAVHYPDNVIDPSLESIHGKVEFTLVDGKIEDPEMVESTGHDGLDKLMLEQVASATVPKPTGPHAAEPHAFSMELNMPTAFELAEYAAINFRKVYPKEAILGAYQGSVTVGFDYLDGKANNLTITKSANNRFLDGASLSAVSKADLPLPPPGYAEKTVHLEVTICYSINNSFKCPTTGSFVQVLGTRFVIRH